jgi:hypothetical protein
MDSYETDVELERDRLTRSFDRVGSTGSNDANVNSSKKQTKLAPF